MTNRTESDHFYALMDKENALAGHGDWLPEAKNAWDPSAVWLHDDDGCSLMVSAHGVAALVNREVRRRTPRG